MPANPISPTTTALTEDSAAKFHDGRLRSKKAHSSKKQSRKGFVD